MGNQRREYIQANGYERAYKYQSQQNGYYEPCLQGTEHIISDTYKELLFVARKTSTSTS
ncbi:hypothetical protein [Facklamia sp. P13064]|uniref:hypothetical protein n=1 Tax=unclassified Facklamia TaxID=2622293 RepID=UPI003D16A349